MTTSLNKVRLNVASSETLQNQLELITAQADEAIDIAEAALVLASVNQPASNLKIYRDHLKAVAKAVAHAANSANLKPDTARPEDMAAVLSRVLAQDFRYAGDEDTYDDLDNANLMRVIDRRKGLPVTLGILYLAAARSQSWGAAGLSFPGYFLIRLESRDGRRAILDPFHGGRILEAPQLRELLKVMAGAAVELEAGHYMPVSNRDVLVRLQNNIKIRRLELGESEGALDALKCMQVLKPDDPNVWRETGVIHMRLGHLKKAVEAFEHFVAHAPEGPDRAKISGVVCELRERLH
ncbi:MAG TPA: hypothetical protein DGZ24_03500 [Rhodospirillaceae bacterium]|nr:hypothetical protein [Rhodospirillaceae bacterium]